MKEAFQPRRRRYAASYFKSGTVYFGTLLFLVSLVLQFIQLFEEAADRAKAGYAPPEDYTVRGIVWRSIFILLVLAICILLARRRSGKLHMGRGRYCVLMGLLTVLFGTIRFVATFLEILVYPEFITILDCLAVGVCLLAPVIMLELGDLNRVPPDDNVLLFLGIGGIGFSIISLLIVGIVLRQSYTGWRLVPEILFRAGLVLYGVAALQAALLLRADYPLMTPVASARKPAPKPAPKAKPRAKADASFTLHLDGEDAQEYIAHTPRPQVSYDEERQYTVRSSGPDMEHANARETESVHAPQQPVSQAQWQTGRIIVQGGTGRIETRDPGTVPSERQTCPYCGKRMPKGFPNCPRCGRDM